MSNENEMQNDQLSYLLKKIEWLEPDRSLAHRIECAVQQVAMHQAYENNFFQFRSPILASMAVMFALVLGVTSGLTTATTASADEYGQSHIYASSSVSLTRLYAGGSDE